MTAIARGPFEAKLTPQKPDNSAAEGSGHGRMALEKQFHGDLEGTSQGEMLSVMGSVKGSAGYVALERVTATLDGKRGTFFLMHNGIMNRGAPGLVIQVVPDSGTGELASIGGTMKITIGPRGEHTYELEYDLA